MRRAARVSATRWWRWELEIQAAAIGFASTGGWYMTATPSSSPDELSSGKRCFHACWVVMKRPRLLQANCGLHQSVLSIKQLLLVANGVNINCGTVTSLLASH